MIEEITIVTPEFSIGTGGLSDYTIRLVQNWPVPINFKILVARKEGDSATKQSIAKLESESAAILQQLPETNGKVLVQYSAYGFHRLGYPRNLLRALVDWKKTRRSRLVVMFHEIWTFCPKTNWNSLIQFFHRRAIKRLADCADVIFTSTESQAIHLRAVAPSAQIHCLPVGSNILPEKGLDLARTPGCAVLFGLQGVRLRALKKWQSDLKLLGSSGRIRKVISIGAGHDLNLADEERAMLAALPLSQGFEQRGPFPEEKVSQLLSRATFGIFAYDELSLTKSGTFMAYAAHKVNVLADFADRLKPEPICWLVAPGELMRGVAESELRQRAERLRDWQQRVCSWDLISRKIADAF